MSDSASNSGSTGQGPARGKRVWRLFHTAFSGWNVIGTLTLISGIAVGVGVPVWQNFWVQRPILSIEMNSLRREIPENVTISLEEVPEFALWKSRLRNEREFVFTSVGFGLPVAGSTTQSRRSRFAPAALTVSLDDLTDLLAASKREQQDLPPRVEQAQKDLDQVKNMKHDEMTYQTLVRLNGPLLRAVNLSSAAEHAQKIQNISANSDYFENLKKEFQEKYQERLSTIDERLKELTSKLPIAERKIEQLRAAISATRSVFRATAVISNSGGGSVSIKAPTLIRVYIGSGNYVDLKLLVEDIRQGLDVKPSGSLSLTFISGEVQSLPKEDQEIITRYWGQNVFAVLFVEDTLGNVHSSNKVPFSEGLYQKIIYDRLAVEAAKPKYLDLGK
jgi:hypothetical protein